MANKLVTYGELPEQSDGHLHRIDFPVLTRLDTWTGDGRFINSAGFATRKLPLPILAQTQTGPGHDGAKIVGALHEITVYDDGVVSGRGYLINNEAAREAAFLVSMQALTGNSVDLADVEAEVEFGENFTIKVTFTKANIAATTLVAVPAFMDASAELVASWQPPTGPLFVDVEPSLTFNISTDDEIAASGITAPWEAFHIPEADNPQKIVVDDNGWVYGHLGLWDSCHDGINARCVRIPRPTDNYASFNKPGVLTDRGLIETGPIFLVGGHRYGIPNDADWTEAYGGVENAWADVRVTAGIHGPWLSGMVRPGISDEMLYAARASRISGHWKNGRLKAIVSVNAEGFDVPGSGFGFTLGPNNELVDLVASFPPCTTEQQTNELSMVTPELARVLLNEIVESLKDNHNNKQLQHVDTPADQPDLATLLALQLEVEDDDEFIE